MVQKSPKTPEISIKWLCWSQNAYRWVLLGWKTDCDVRIMIFRVFEGVRLHCDVKYDVRYNKIAKNVIQMLYADKWSNWAINLYGYIFSREERDGGVRILIFDVKYHEMGHNFVYLEFWTISWYLTSYLTTQSRLSLPLSQNIRILTPPSRSSGENMYLYKFSAQFDHLLAF